MKTLTLAIFLVSSAVISRAASEASSWSHSVVTIRVTRQVYSYIQPWTRRTTTNRKFGVVIDSKRILTTADHLYNQVLIRVQKDGRGLWRNAELDWIDYHANLALLKVDQDAFWTDLVPVKLADPVPATGQASLVRWNDRRLEIRGVEINRLRINRGKLTYIDLLEMELDSEVNGVGWSEPIVVGDQVVALTTSQTRNKCTSVPASFIVSVLKEQAKASYRGLGFFNFYWQRAENPTTLKYLQVPDGRAGVIVTKVPPLLGDANTLEPLDVILAIDGFDIDLMGDYTDPDYGIMMLENLATRNRWAGDEIPMKIWRDGKVLDIAYRLPKAEFSRELVPTALPDEPPEYLMAGGLVFLPLTVPYLKSWGTDWSRRAPVRLIHYKGKKPSEDRPALVVLSVVLPDPYNLGYQNLSSLVVHKVNGQKISRLPELKAALAKPQGGFHIIEFERGEPIQKIVLDAATLAEATQRVMARYGVTADYLFVSREPGEPAPAHRAGG